MSNRNHNMNPFPGLRPFTEEEDYLFFGREEQTLELLSRLGRQRFVAVVGASGSGKSSLVRCGLLSELQGGKMRSAGASWEIAVMHPGGNPLGLLTEALLDADIYDRAEENSRENLLATLSRSHFGLVEAIKQAGLGEDTNFLLVVDQFEEIFRFHEAGQTQQEMANEFVSMLLEAAAQKDVSIYVVLTMRSDFIGECGQFEGLAEMVNRGEFLIPRLSRQQYKRIIEGPIKVAGGQIAPRLLQRLLNDLGQQTDQLPCLQHALMRTWNVWADKGDQDALDLDDYQRVGKMTHALSLHADEIYDALATDRQRQLCRGLFQALTVQESESRGIRRPQRLGRLCQILDVSSEELLPIIDAYRQKGVTFLMPGPEVELSDRTIIDISHESLMRVWTRLRNWVDEEAQAAGIYLRLSESAALYEQGKAGLYRDPELSIALAWQESQHPNAAWAERYRPGFDAAMAFLTASQEASVAEEQAQEAARQHELEQARQLAEAQRLRLAQQRRATKRLRKLIAGLAVVAAIAGLACVAALVARNEASRLAGVAEQQANHARQNEEKANENAKRAEQSQKETADALAIVESQKAKAEAAERVAKAAEETGRKLLYTTDMRLAPFVWKDDRTTAEQLRLLLTKHIPDSKAANEKPDLRGFEWHYYQHLLERSATVFSGHGVSLVGGAFTPNGQLVTLDENGQVRRWDLGTQDEDRASRRDLPGGPAAQVRVLSPNGRLAALVEGNKVHVFDTATGKETFQIDSASNNQWRRLIFSRDNNLLVIVDDKIRWLNAASGAVIASVDQKFDRIESLALTADGLTLAVVGHGGMGQQFSIFHLDAAAKKATALAKNLGPRGTLEASALSPDGQRIAVGAKLSGTLLIFDTATGRMIASHRSAHASAISAMAFSGDGARLATADAEGTIKIWTDAQKLNSKSTAFVTLKGHQGKIPTAAFSSDGKRLVTTSADKTARVWDLENAGEAIRPLGHSGSSFVARFSPDGQLIACAAGKSVRLWDSATGRLVRELSAGDHKGTIASVAFSPTDNRLLAVGYGGQAEVSHVALWDIDAGTELARLPGATDLPGFRMDQHSGVVAALAFSPDGKYLAAGFGSKNLLLRPGIPCPLKIWEVAPRRLIRRLNGHTGYCLSLDFSHDGKWLASGSRDGTAIIWSTATWKAMQTLQNPDKNSLYSGRGMIEDTAFSPDSKTLVLASREGSVQLWDVASGNLLETLKGHSSSVYAVVFSPDGRTLASGSGDQTVRLWNVETRRQLMQLDSGSVGLGQVQTLAFSPEGRHLLAGGDSNTAVWSAAPIVWNDPDRAAAKLRLLLQSNADFRSRIHMLSENLRLHEAVAKLDTKDRRVQVAWAATRANWHASQQRWGEAVKEVDRLLAAGPTSPGAWFRTPGLLRLATALLYQDRPAHAATLLQGGAKRRTEDGLSPVATIKDANGRMKSEFLVASSAFTPPPSALVLSLLAVLTREPFISDPATGEQLYLLRAAVEKWLANKPRDAGLLELRAELAGQWSDYNAQVADYTAAIRILAEQPAAAAAAQLRRLYHRRGDAYVSLKHWQKATDDYARVVTEATTDEALLSNQALAQANVILERESPATWTVLKPTEMKSEGGADLMAQPDGSILVSGTNPERDVYSLVAKTDLKQITAIRLEALPDPSLPLGNSGRAPGNGNFALSEWKVTAQPRNSSEVPRPIRWKDAWSDHRLEPADHYNKRPMHIGMAIDGDRQTYWEAWPKGSSPHWAIFLPHEPISGEGGSQLKFLLEFQSLTKHNLGRFRLSVSEDPAIFARGRHRFAARTLTDPWQKLAAAYRIQSKQQAIDHLVERHPKLAGQIGDLFTQGMDEDKDWQRAVEIYSMVITARTTDGELLSKRARAYEVLKKWDAAAADWLRAATGNPEGAKLLADFARRLAAAGQVPLAKAQFGKSQALYEQALTGDPGNDPVATELAQLLLDKDKDENPGQWTVLKPVEAKSERGATLSILPDNSILASGADLPNDRYRVVLKVGTSIDLSAVRLDALTHPSLPANGPGRYPGRDGGQHKGTFNQVSWKVTATSPNRKDPLTLEFDKASADVKTIYPIAKEGWNIAGGGEGRNCTAIWPLSKPVSLIAGTTLTCEMQFGVYAGAENLGHFRLSVTDDRASLVRKQSSFAAMQLTDPWSKLAAAYAMNGRTDEASQYFGRALQPADDYEARKPILEFAARFDEIAAVLSERHPDDPQLQLALARGLAARGKQHLAEKHPAQAQAELEKAREVFTQLRAKVAEPWSVLTPTEWKSQGGETLTVEKDGSIFVSGPNPTRAVYTLKMQTDLPTLHAILLETIPDPRLPNGAAGRFGNGNFHLGEFTAVIVSGQPNAKPIPIEFGSVMADVSQNPEYAPAKSIDGDPRTRWDALESGASLRETHWAAFVLKSPMRMDGGSLRIALDSGITEWGMHGLGRFRLSATNEADLSRALVANDLKDSEVVDLCVALAKAHAQQGRDNEAVDSLTEALHLAVDRAGKAKIIAEAAALQVVLEKLAEHAAGDGQFQAELARHYAERGNAPSADAARAKARALFEEKLAKEPETTALAAELADVLLIDSSSKWTVLKPTAMKSQGGATLTELDDHSILVGGVNPKKDTFTFVTQSHAKIKGLRLEALAHGSLVNGGPGRNGNGNFALSEISVKAEPFSGGGKAANLKLINPQADFEQDVQTWDTRKYPVADSLDGKIDTAWSILPQTGRDHAAVFEIEPSPQTAFAGGTKLTFTLDFQSYDLHAIGRFRLSVSEDSSIVARERGHLAVRRLTDPWAKLAVAYHTSGDQRALDKLLKQRPRAAVGIGDLYAANQDWKRALAEYNKAITKDSKDARVFAARAEAYEKLEKWELAAADWGNVDRYASDKKARYGNPSFPALERRASIHGRLQQWDKQVQDYNELLKPERLGDNPWIFLKRGEAYDRLRQWQKARADYEQALKVSSPEERGAFHAFRARHFAWQGQWKQAAEDMQQVYKKPADFNSGIWWRDDWWCLRDAALIFAAAGDVDNYGKAAAACSRKQSAASPNPDDSKWTVLTMLLFPEMITKENRPRLLELAGKTDAFWQPRLTAAIYFRSSDDKKAAELFDANGGGPRFMFLAAMAQQRRGKHDRAKQLLEEGNSWVRDQRAKDPGAGVPRPYSWHDWISVITLQHEASDLIRGPGVGSGK